MEDTSIPPSESTQQNQVREPETPPVDSTEKLLSGLGYIGFLCVLPLILRRESKFCQYHGKQGLVLAIADLIIRLFTVTGWFYTFLLIIYYLVIAYSILQASKGKYFSLPLVSDIAKELKI